jgi:hypothetical protein
MTSSEIPGGPPLGPQEKTPERPNLRLLSWYSIGGSLLPRYNSWVLYDVTCRTWWLRHFARVFAIITPISAVCFLVLVPNFGAPAAYAGVGLFGTLLFAGMTFILIDSDRRAVRAGYPTDYAGQVRSRRATETQHTANYQRRERIAARRARRYSKQ